jgi:hypothetical protein
LKDRLKIENQTTNLVYHVVLSFILRVCRVENHPGSYALGA